MLRNLLRGTFGLILALGLAPTAGALDITGLVITKIAGNTLDNTTNTGQNFSDTRSTVSTTLSPLSAPDTLGSFSEFTTRYAMIAGLDRQMTSGTATTNMASAYTITFTVDNPTGAQVQIDIDTLRAGTLTSITDSTGNTTITLGAATGQLDTNGGGFVAQPNLGAIAASLTSGADADQPFNQTNTLTISTNALTTTYVLQFNFASSVVSATDEGAIRMGIAGGVNNSTADDYPGVTFPRNATQQANDGHFVNVTATITAVPEPGPGGLVAFGLLGLALRARRARS
jgi:hypothetical protein